MKKKVVVFGIDGGTFNIMKPLMQRNRLQNIASLLQRGSSASLISIVPPITAPAWSSFMTGVNPGKHGIFDFISDIHNYAKEGDVLNSTHIRAKTIWQALSEAGKKLIVIGVPFAYPPVKINGSMISLSMSNIMDTYPQELKQEIEDKIGYDYDRCKPVDTFGEMPKDKVLDEIIVRNRYLTEKIKEMSCYMLDNKEWDFFMSHFMATDTIQHYFWHFMDKEHPSHDETLAEKYKNTINETYEDVDQAIGEILKKAGTDCNVMIVSDHGFAPVYQFFYVNKWLEEIGLLKIKKTGSCRWEFASPSLYKILFKAGYEKFGNNLPEVFRKFRVPAVKKIEKNIAEMIDWNNTKAYASPFGININLRGREPGGIVSAKGEYEEIKKLVKEKLLKLADHETGEQLIKKVYFKDEVYKGRFVDNASDIFFFFDKPCFLQSSSINNNAIFEKLSHRNFATANHRYSPEGIFVISGADICAKNNISPASILDMAPTILYLMGADIPKVMDGRLLEEIINPEKINLHLPKYSEGEEILKDDSGTYFEDEHIKEHLRRLGYLG